MSKGSLFVGWGAIIPGREKKASEVLGNALQYLQGIKSKGVIDDFDVVLLEPHGGELEGFVIVNGEKDSIAKLRVDEEFLRVIIGVQLVHNKVGIVGAYRGKEMQSIMKIWDEQEDKLIP